MAECCCLSARSFRGKTLAAFSLHAGRLSVPSVVGAVQISVNQLPHITDPDNSHRVSPAIEQSVAVQTRNISYAARIKPGKSQ